jgi:small subunit ribosomal protein S17
VKSIIAPFGEPIENRPPVPTEEERVAERQAKLDGKRERRRLKKEGEAGEVEGESLGSGEKVQA